MSYPLISSCFFFITLLLHFTLSNLLQGRTLHLGQSSSSIDIDVSDSLENGLFLLPASLGPGIPVTSPPDHPANDSAATTATSPSSSFTSYYSPLSSSKPFTVKASFGSISTTETVYPYHGTYFGSLPYFKNQLKSHSSGKPSITPAPPPPLSSSSSRQSANGAAFRDKITDSTLVEIDSAHGTHSIAHLVTLTVSRNSPVVRVLFYTNHPIIHSTPTTSSSGDQTSGESKSTNLKSSNKDNKLNPTEGNGHGGVGSDPLYKASPCIFVSVSKDGENLLGSCTPINNREGACLVEITLPAYWWPPVELDSVSPKSRKPALLSIDYKTFHTNQCTQNGSLVNENIKRLSSLTDAFTHLGLVTLVPFTEGYEEVTNDDIVRILIPRQPTYPNNKIYIPVFFRYNPNYPMTAFRLRARVKSGLRILGVQPSPASPWRITVEVNSKQTLATVTAKLRENLMDSEDLQSGDPGIPLSLSQEIYSWLIQVNENVDFSDNGRIVWQLEYVDESEMNPILMDPSSSSASPITGSSSRKEGSDRDTSKLSSILDIQKDDIQAVIGITQSLSMINTAMLTGKQVAQSLRVFAVSQAGRIGDVTLQASCTSTDESVLKVSPSCTSIYLDGSEIRGSSNATVSIKYGTYTGQANFIIWVPKLPLEIRLSDTKLSQIKGWKIVHLKREGRRSYHHQPNGIHGHNGHKSRRSSVSGTSSSPTPNKVMNDKIDFNSPENDIGCKLRHQQAYIEVVSPFFSIDHNSGRESYLLNRKVSIQLTKLVLPFIRITDSRIAIIRSNIIEGLYPGRAEVQIFSPITNQILGSTEVQVSSEKEVITHLEVNLVTGLSLTIKPEPSLTNVWRITANVSSKLVNQYQEGLLDIKLHFSDDSVTSLSDINDSDYQLSINTFDNGGVAYAPLIGQPYPRVIAIGQGNNQLHLSLEVSDQCQRKRTQPLAMSFINADVDLNLPSGHLQNDADFRKHNGILVHRSSSSNSPIATNYRDKNSDDYIDSQTNPIGGPTNSMESYLNVPSIEARSNRAIGQSELTPLEIGMYAMLAVFTLAVSLFIVSCVVFRIKGKQTSDLMVATLPLPVGHNHHPSTSNQKVLANANDWIWLGKATLQRNSIPTGSTSTSKGRPDEASRGLISMKDLKTREGPNHHHLEVTSKENGSNRMSQISFPGSEISIRITANPVEEAFLEDEVTPKPSTPFAINKEIERFYRSMSPSTTTSPTTNQTSSIPPPVPARRTKGHPNSLHIASSSHNHRLSTTQQQREPLFDRCEPVIIPNHKPPHIPPRLTRSIRCDRPKQRESPPSSTASSSSSFTPFIQSARPPPVPPHSANSQTTKKPPLPPHKTVPSKFRRSSAANSSSSTPASNINTSQFKPSPGDNQQSAVSTRTNSKPVTDHINRQTVINPGSALIQLNQEKLDQVTKDMNYQQLIEYFQNLQESSA